MFAGEININSFLDLSEFSFYTNCHCIAQLSSPTLIILTPPIALVMPGSADGGDQGSGRRMRSVSGSRGEAGAGAR